MKSRPLGKSTSKAAEVLGISKSGVWLMVGDEEYFLSHRDFPWFQDAKVSAVYDVKLLHGMHLHWPELDVDLEVASLKDPASYPLVYR